MQLQQLAEQTWEESHRETFKEVPLDSVSPAHQELRDIIKQLQLESLSHIVRAPLKKQKKQKKFKFKKEKKKKTAVYTSHFYQVIVPLFYTPANIYELHYGSMSAKKREEQEYESEATRIERPHQHIAEESPEQMNQIIQRIISAKLSGTLSDLGAEEKEKFKNWREFNKHLRRLYEGANYWTSITKFV